MDESTNIRCLTRINQERREFLATAPRSDGEGLAAKRSGVQAAGTETASGPTGAAVESYLEQDVAKFFYRWGGLLSSTLIRIRGRFHGDLDAYLIYLSFLLTDLAQVVAANDAVRRGAAPRTPSRRGLNALSVADITRIPRETVRRKLHALSACGYLVRDSEGLFYLGDIYGLDEFFRDLKPLFWDGLRLAAG